MAVFLRLGNNVHFLIYFAFSIEAILDNNVFAKVSLGADVLLSRKIFLIRQLNLKFLEEH